MKRASDLVAFNDHNHILTICVVLNLTASINFNYPFLRR